MRTVGRIDSLNGACFVVARPLTLGFEKPATKGHDSKGFTLPCCWR